MPLKNGYPTRHLGDGAADGDVPFFCSYRKAHNTPSVADLVKRTPLFLTKNAFVVDCVQMADSTGPRPLSAR